MWSSIFYSWPAGPTPGFNFNIVGQGPLSGERPQGENGAEPLLGPSQRDSRLLWEMPQADPSYARAPGLIGTSVVLSNMPFFTEADQGAKYGVRFHGAQTVRLSAASQASQTGTTCLLKSFCVA